MATVDITQAARSLVEEVFGKGNFDAFDAICDAGYRIHGVTGDSDLRQEKETCRMYKTAFPDLTPTILGCCAEGDTVVTHWTMTGTHQRPLMGIQPTGKRYTFDVMSVGRFRGGKLVEESEQWDDGGALAFALLRQTAQRNPQA
jgi:predicted ester cyclase